MDMVIIGWLVVIYLFGSVIYSTQFHLGNYLLQKQRIKSGEVGGAYKQLHKQTNRGILIFIQLIKLIVAISVAYLLLQ